MSLLLEIGLIFFICISGDLIANVLPLPIPGNIIGMLLLLILLSIKWVKLDYIERIGQFFLKNMAFFFIPAGVSIMQNIAVLEGQIVQILVVCIVSTIVTFGVTGWTAQLIIRYQQKRKESR